VKIALTAVTTGDRGIGPRTSGIGKKIDATSVKMSAIGARIGGTHEKTFVTDPTTDRGIGITGSATTARALAVGPGREESIAALARILQAPAGEEIAVEVDNAYRV